MVETSVLNPSLSENKSRSEFLEDISIADEYLSKNGIGGGGLGDLGLVSDLFCVSNDKDNIPINDFACVDAEDFHLHTPRSSECTIHIESRDHEYSLHSNNFHIFNGINMLNDAGSRKNGRLKFVGIFASGSINRVKHRFSILFRTNKRIRNLTQECECNKIVQSMKVDIKDHRKTTRATWIRSLYRALFSTLHLHERKVGPLPTSEEELSAEAPLLLLQPLQRDIPEANTYRDKEESVVGEGFDAPPGKKVTYDEAYAGNVSDMGNKKDTSPLLHGKVFEKKAPKKPRPLVYLTHSLKGKQKVGVLEGFRRSTTDLRKSDRKVSISHDAKATLSLVWSYRGLSKIPMNGIRGVRSAMITRIYLNNNGLSSIPDDFFELTPNLIHVDLSDNFLTSIVIGAGAVTSRLRHLEASKNLLTKFSIPRDKLPDLSYIDLSDNQMKDIPDNIFIPERAKKLTYVDLSNNRINSITPDISLLICSPTPKILRLVLNPLKLNTGMILLKEASKRAGCSFVSYLLHRFPELRGNLRSNLATNASKFAKTQVEDLEEIYPHSQIDESEVVESFRSLEIVPDEVMAISITEKYTTSTSESYPTIILKALEPGPSSTILSGETRYNAPGLESTYDMKVNTKFGSIYGFLFTWWLCSLNMDTYLLRHVSYAESPSQASKRFEYISSLFFKAWDFCPPNSTSPECVHNSDATGSFNADCCPTPQNTSVDQTPHDNSSHLVSLRDNVPTEKNENVNDELAVSPNLDASRQKHLGSLHNSNSVDALHEQTRREVPTSSPFNTQNLSSAINTNDNTNNQSEALVRNSNAECSKRNKPSSIASWNNCDTAHAADTTERKLAAESYGVEVVRKLDMSGELNMSHKLLHNKSLKSSEGSTHPIEVLEYKIRSIVCGPVCSLACHLCNYSNKLSAMLEKANANTVNLSKLYLKWLDLTSGLLRDELDYVTQLKGLLLFLESKVTLGSRIKPVCGIILHLVREVIYYHLQNLVVQLPAIIGGIGCDLVDKGIGKYFMRIIPDLKKIYSIYSINYEVVVDLIKSLKGFSLMPSESVSVSTSSFSPRCEESLGKDFEAGTTTFTWKGVLYTAQRTLVPVSISLDAIGLAEWRLWCNEQSLGIPGSQSKLLSLLKLPKTRLLEYSSSISSIREALVSFSGLESQIKDLDSCTAMLEECVNSCRKVEPLGLMVTHCWKLTSAFCPGHSSCEFLDIHNDDLPRHSLHMDDIKSYIGSSKPDRSTILAEEALCGVALLSNLNIVNVTEVGNVPIGEDNGNENLEGDDSTRNPLRDSVPGYRFSKNKNHRGSAYANIHEEPSSVSNHNSCKITRGFEFLSNHPIARTTYPQLPSNPSKVLLFGEVDSLKNHKSPIAMYPSNYRVSPEEAYRLYKDTCEDSAKFPTLINLGGVLKALSLSSNKKKSESSSASTCTSPLRSSTSWVVTPYRILWINTRVDVNRSGNGITEECCTRTWVHSFYISNTRISRVLDSPFPSKTPSKIVRVWDDKVSVHLWNIDDAVYEFLESILPTARILTSSLPTTPNVVETKDTMPTQKRMITH